MPAPGATLVDAKFAEAVLSVTCMPPAMAASPKRARDRVLGSGKSGSVSVTAKAGREVAVKRFSAAAPGGPEAAAVHEAFVGAVCTNRVIDAFGLPVFPRVLRVRRGAAPTVHMEAIRASTTLAAAVEDPAVPAAEIIGYVAQVYLSLAAASRIAAFVHNDLHAENIILSRPPAAAFASAAAAKRRQFSLVFAEADDTVIARISTPRLATVIDLGEASVITELAPSIHGARAERTLVEAALNLHLVTPSEKHLRFSDISKGTPIRDLFILLADITSTAPTNAAGRTPADTFRGVVTAAEASIDNGADPRWKALLTAVSDLGERFLSSVECETASTHLDWVAALAKHSRGKVCVDPDGPVLLSVIVAKMPKLAVSIDVASAYRTLWFECDASTVKHAARFIGAAERFTAAASACAARAAAGDAEALRVMAALKTIHGPVAAALRKIAAAAKPDKAAAVAAAAAAACAAMV